jgi:hypothetical protein
MMSQLLWKSEMIGRQSVAIVETQKTTGRSTVSQTIAVMRERVIALD